MTELPTDIWGVVLDKLDPASAAMAACTVKGTVPPPPLMSHLCSRIGGLLGRRWGLTLRSLGEHMVVISNSVFDQDGCLASTQLLAAVQGDSPTVIGGHHSRDIENIYEYVSEAGRGDDLLITIRVSDPTEEAVFTLHERLPRKPQCLKAFANAMVARLRKTWGLFSVPPAPSVDDEELCRELLLDMATNNTYMELYTPFGLLSLQSSDDRTSIDVCWRGVVGLGVDVFSVTDLRGRASGMCLRWLMSKVLSVVNKCDSGVANVANHWALPLTTLTAATLHAGVRGAACTDISAASQKAWPRIVRLGMMFCDHLTGTAVMPPLALVMV